jgi:ABC-type transport system involved in multi-copper enzyme maturation permease subunit
MHWILAAEWLKQVKLNTARSLVVVVWCLSAVIISVQIFAHATGHMPLLDNFGIAGGLHGWSYFWVGVCSFVPPVFAAWGSGLEQSFDTWKTVLVRHPRRWPFVVAKLGTAFVWTLLLSAGSLLIWLTFARIAEAFFGAAAPFEGPGGFSAALRATLSAAQALLLFPFIQFVALRSRSNATLYATVAGIGFPLACRTLAGQWKWFDRISPLSVTEALFRALRAAPFDAVWLTKTVGEDWPRAALVIVLIFWFVLPLVASLVSFEHKDIVSEVS